MKKKPAPPPRSNANSTLNPTTTTTMIEQSKSPELETQTSRFLENLETKHKWQDQLKAEEDPALRSVKTSQARLKTEEFEGMISKLIERKDQQVVITPSKEETTKP